MNLKITLNFNKMKIIKHILYKRILQNQKIITISRINLQNRLEIKIIFYIGKNKI